MQFVVSFVELHPRTYLLCNCIRAFGNSCFLSQKVLKPLLLGMMMQKGFYYHIWAHII